MAEAVVERALVTGATNRGWWCPKSAIVPGFPDRMLLASGGRLVFVELKARGERPRRLQRYVHRKLRGLGFRVEVIDSMQGVDALFQELDG